MLVHPTNITSIFYVSRGNRSRKLENEPDLVKGEVPPTKPANRISAFHCGERACWYSFTVARICSLCWAPLHPQNSSCPFRLRAAGGSARNSDLTVWVRVSVDSSPKPLGNPSTAPKHPFLEVSLSPHDADFRCFRNKTAGFCLKACPGRNLSVCQTWIVASLRSFLRRLCISGHNASKRWQ